MARTLALVAAAGVLGFLLGLLIPTPAHGTGWTPKFLFTPQAGVNSTCLSCGWHSVCLPPYPWGTGLDFPAGCSDSGQDVYFRNFGFKPSGGQEWVAWGTPRDVPGTTCKTAEVKIFDTNMNGIGYMRYVHTYKTRDADMMMYVSGDGHKNEYVFASMVDADDANCPGWVWLEEQQIWYWPIHLHEAHLNGASTFYLRDDADCDDDDRYPCAPGSGGPYNPQDWWNDWTRALCIDDTDSDGDGVPDCLDNCPPIANPGQADADGDTIGNVCELDVDCDGGHDIVDVLMILMYIVGRATPSDQCPPPPGSPTEPRATAYDDGVDIGDGFMGLHCIVGYHNIVCPGVGGGPASPPTADPVTGQGDEPTVGIESGEIPEGGSEVTRLSALDVGDPPLCGVTVDIGYDRLVNVATDCDPDPEGNFDAAVCNADYASDTVRVTAGNADGLAGDVPLADITWCALGSAGEWTDLNVQIVSFKDCGDPPAEIPVADQDGVNVIVAGSPPVDTDGDGFDDCVEAYLGTDPFDDCSNDCSTTKLHDAWPLDIIIDCRITIGDVLTFSGKIGCDVGEACYRARWDLDADGHITIGDVLRYNCCMGDTCT